MKSHSIKNEHPDKNNQLVENDFSTCCKIFSSGQATFLDREIKNSDTRTLIRVVFVHPDFLGKFPPSEVSLSCYGDMRLLQEVERIVLQDTAAPFVSRSSNGEFPSRLTSESPASNVGQTKLSNWYLVPRILRQPLVIALEQHAYSCATHSTVAGRGVAGRSLDSIQANYTCFNSLETKSLQVKRLPRDVVH